MKKIIFTFFIATLFISCKKNTVSCAINTTEGEIIVELYPKKAPITVANFLNYVDEKYYDDTSFFRVCTPENEAKRDIKIQVIQGGTWEDKGERTPIVLETTEQTGIKHLNGVISMARDKPNSATQSFFICIGDQPSLDYGGKRNPDGQGFAAFGKVTKGMDIVLKIQAKKNKDQMLLEPVMIESVRRIE